MGLAVAEFSMARAANSGVLVPSPPPFADHKLEKFMTSICSCNVRARRDVRVLYSSSHQTDAETDPFRNVIFFF